MRIGKWIAVIAMAASSIGEVVCADAQVAKSTTDTGPAFSLSLSAKQAQVKVGESIQLVVSLKNTSKKLIYVGKEHHKSGKVDYGYHVIALDDGGNMPTKTRYYRYMMGESLPDGLMNDVINEVGGRIEFLPLQPGESIESDVNVMRFYNIELPGKYEIWVELYDDQSKIRVKSNTITVTVTP